MTGDQRKRVSPFFLWMAIAFFFMGGITTLGSVNAASFDYYVKEGEDGDGSEGDPFGTLADAVKAIGDRQGKKLYLSSGKYAGAVAIPKGTTVVGADAKSVTITGKLTLEDDVELEKLGFSGMGNVLVTKNARASIEQARFKDVNTVAIKTEQGKTVVIIEDTLIDNARKGIYLQAGTRAEIEDLQVINGREEGIDIRENVSGFVRDSEFRGNAESGVEIVLGSAEFTLSGNAFTNNGASGISAQFFDGASKLGNVRIEGNTFSKNNYGVNCKAPSGNLDSKLYYLNSLNITNNTYKENRIADIASACRILTDEERATLAADEAKQEALEVSRTASLALTDTALQARLTQSVAFRKNQLEKYAAAERTRLEPVFQAIDTLVQTGSQATDAMAQKRSRFSCYLGGVAQDEARLEQSVVALETLVMRLREESSTLQHASNQSNQPMVDEKIAQLISLQQKMRETLESPTCRFSVFGWITRHFGNDKTPVFGAQAEAITLRDTSPDAKALFLGALSYYPKVREVAVRFGDERLVTGLLEKSAEYREVIGDLRLPLGNEADPLPPVGATSELAFPVRFSNYFASAHVNTLHLSNAAQINANPVPFQKTVTNLSYAGIQTLGSIPGEGEDKATGETHTITWLGEKKLHWVAYRENSGTLASVRETIAPLADKNEPVVVVIAWDEKQGKVMGPKREEWLREIVKAGASLIIGTGLVIPYEQKMLENVPVYTSLGSAFEKFQTGDTSKKSVALELGIEADDKLRVTEKNLVFTAEKGLELQP